MLCPALVSGESEVKEGKVTWWGKGKGKKARGEVGMGVGGKPDSEQGQRSKVKEESSLLSSSPQLL